MKKIFSLLFVSILLCQFAAAQPARLHRSITWEKFNASGPGLVQIGLIETLHSKDIQSSSWSVGCETLDRDYARFSLYKDYVGELGVKHARLQSGWAKCEKQKGVYNFAWLDTCVYGLNEQGVKPWMCLCYGNPLYGSGINLGAGLAPLVNSKEAMAAWLKYVEATVKRYKDVITEWEVWNEPNGSGGEVYARLLMPTAELIKKLQPDAVVFGLSLAGIPLDFTKDVFETLKAGNKVHLVDYLTYHPYNNHPEASYPAVEELKKLAQSYNPKIKLYQGENGCPSILEWGHALSGYPWTEYSQAKWFLRRLTGDRLREIPTSAFTLVDLRYTNMLQSFGLLRMNLLNQVMYKRPSYYAVQHLVSFFDDSVTPTGELQYRANIQRKVTVAGFKKGNSPVVLAWFSDQIPSDLIQWDPVNLTILNTTFNDPVYVEMITGKVYNIDKKSFRTNNGATSFTGLPLWDSPVMIAERSQVNLRTE